MADRPILFSGPMVRALLAGTKTQTRRHLDAWCDEPSAFVEDGVITAFDEKDRPYRWPHTKAVGDRLYVREAWCDANSDNGPVICYRADYHRWSPPYSGPNEGAGPSFDYERYPGNYCVWASDLERTDKGWRPGIHQPKWASRITLHVTEVRVQRLHDITEADAIAEGIEQTLAGHNRLHAYCAPEPFNEVTWDTGREAYAELWRRINGPTSWKRNPWVAAYTFAVEKANIDQARLAA